MMERFSRSFFKDILIIAALTILINLLVWLPHYLKFSNFYNLNFSPGMETIYKNYDGLEYIVIAKSFYLPQLITPLSPSLSPAYFASHFPLYPLLIFLIAPVMGFLKAMIIVPLLFTIFSAVAFYLLVRDFKLSDHPLFLSLIFLVLPGRWLIVHSVGSAEPIFIFFTILSLYYFMKYEQLRATKFIWLSAIAALFAQLTRPPGILLFIALALFVHYKFYLESKLLGFKKALVNHLIYYPFILVPLGLLAVFVLFSVTLGDFWAYFHSGDNIHLTFPPFQVFNKAQPWVGDIWLEDIIYVFVLGFLGAMLLLKQKLLPLAFFVFTYLIATILVAHRDFSRYALPVFPFVMIAYQKTLVSKEFKIVLAIVALAIYLYTQNFLLNNTAPVAVLDPFN